MLHVHCRCMHMQRAGNWQHFVLQGIHSFILCHLSKMTHHDSESHSEDNTCASSGYVVLKLRCFNIL